MGARRLNAPLRIRLLLKDLLNVTNLLLHLPGDLLPSPFGFHIRIVRELAHLLLRRAFKLIFSTVFHVSLPFVPCWSRREAKWPRQRSRRRGTTKQCYG